ncbi:heptosyltransferase-1 [Desulfatibacillum alkenivorans DSM 16219]|jgi:heptosyltransferase-1|uniref:Heptosyltransferase-1 n=1 Tax=Desulfatibacillum alkenivorans DSM 16219 TaxID=1121393 RepID=A0A1M6VEI1_9BACT|nr:glycosyltransferase family 9 protein [Desulfatibacillum alkenivorans]SHK79933.1 heptosyltransferase-1 [Desulfatibacillum alkenivorans DSM 16219]
MAPHYFIIRWSGMGDIVMSLPALAFLREKQPDCRITYLTDVPFMAIPLMSGLVDHVAPLDRRGFAKPGRISGALGGAVSIVSQLRKDKPDIAFDLQGFGETAVLAWLSGAPIRVGRIKKSGPRKWIYTQNIDADWGTDHRSAFFVKAAAQGLGLPAPVHFDRPRLEIPGLTPVEGLVCLNMGASTESRRWSEENFIALGKSLSQKGYAIRLLLGPQETHILDAAKAAAEEFGWEIAMPESMEDLAKACGEASLMVSNDTGPGHLAAALGVSVITIYSTGDPDNVGPLAPRTAWFRDREDINRIAPGGVELACLNFLE